MKPILFCLLHFCLCCAARGVLPGPWKKSSHELITLFGNSGQTFPSFPQSVYQSPTPLLIVFSPCCIVLLHSVEYPWETSPNLATRGIVLESWKHDPHLDLSVSSEINKMKAYFVHYGVSGLSRQSCISDIFRNEHLYVKRIDTCKIFFFTSTFMNCKLSNLRLLEN